MENSPTERNPKEIRDNSGGIQLYRGGTMWDKSDKTIYYSLINYFKQWKTNPILLHLSV